MTDELATIELDLEVIGRSPKSWMSLADITWVLEEVRRFGETHQLNVGGSPTPKLGSPPTPELFAHPEAAAILRRFHELWGLVETPVLTSGVDLVRRPDGRELLETLRNLGTSALWWTFYGTETVHDRAVQPRGAYHAGLRAIELTRSIGMYAGCNLMVTTKSLPQLEPLIGDLQHAGIQEIIPCLTDFVPTTRERRNERIRPTWPDVQRLVPTLGTIPETANWRRFWQEVPHKHTEAWYVQQALAGTWPAEPALRTIWLVCRPNLDVYHGVAGYPGRSYGNLRREGVDAVLSRAVVDGPCSLDEIWFAPEPQEHLTDVRTLATRFGQADSLRLHNGPGSIRRWWLECARRARVNET